MTHPTDKQAQDVVEGRAKPLRQNEFPIVIVARQALEAWARDARHVIRAGRLIPLPVETPFGEDPVVPDAAWLGG